MLNNNLTRSRRWNYQHPEKRRKENAHWRKQNPKKYHFDVYHSEARTFIRHYASTRDLRELISLAKHQLSSRLVG